MNNKPKLIACLASILLTTACEHKEILPGKRLQFFSTVDSVEVDKSLSNAKVDISKASSINSYTEVAGNSRHNSINYELQNSLKTKWKASIGDNAGTDLIIHNGKIFTVNTGGELVCVNEKTGELLWKKQIYYSRDRVPFEGGIAISGDSLIIATSQGEVLKIDIKTQKELLKHNLKLPIKGTPVVIGNKIIVTTVDNMTFALSDSNNTKIWDRTGSEEETIMSGIGTPAVYGGNLICAYTNGDVVSLDANTGIESWEDTLFSGDTSESGFIISHIVSSPVIYGDKVLVCTSESKTALIDISSGVRIWEKNIGSVNIPVISNNWIFLLTSDNSLKCLSVTDGAVKWNHTFSNPGKLFGPLLINGDVVIFSEHGEMMSISAQTGTQKSSIKLDTTISRAPIIVNSNMYIVTNSSDILCLK